MALVLRRLICMQAQVFARLSAYRDSMDGPQASAADLCLGSFYTDCTCFSSSASPTFRLLAALAAQGTVGVSELVACAD